MQTVDFLKGGPVQVQPLVVGEEALDGPDEVEVRRHGNASGLEL
jgi:hypothetical protein